MDEKLWQHTWLEVDRRQFRLNVFARRSGEVRFQHVRSYQVAVGMEGLATPAGRYLINSRSDKPAWRAPDSDWVPESIRGQVFKFGNPDNPIKGRWLGIYDGAGIHGVDPDEYDSLGTAASHGCVRMRIPDVIELYDRVSLGTPVRIT